MKKALLVLFIIISLMVTGCVYEPIDTDVIINGDLTVSGNTTTNWIEISHSGWDDLRFPVQSLKVNDARPPIWSDIITPGQTLAFEDKAIALQEEQVSFIVQLPHSWEEGTQLYFHIHYAYPSSIPDTRSTWTLEYDWQNENELFGLGTTTITCYTEYSDADVLKSQRVYFPAINGTGKTFSSILVCSLTRHSSDVSDNYTDNVNLLEIDVHYQINTFGSYTQESK